MNILFTIFYQPIANALFILMDIANTNSIVLGILLLVIATKLLLLPTSIKNTKIQNALGAIAGDLKDIKETVKDKKEQMEKTMEVYKKAQVNPFSPILFLLIQIPFFISIFFITRDIGMGTFNTEKVLYDFVGKPEFIDFAFLSLNTAEKGIISIAILIGVSQLILMLQTQKKSNEANKNTKMLTYILPPFIALISLSLAATVSVYWLFNNIVSILQEIGIKNLSPKEESANDNSTKTEEPAKEKPTEEEPAGEKPQNTADTDT